MDTTNHTPSANADRQPDLELFVSPQADGNLLTHTPVLELGPDHILRVSTVHGDGRLSLFDTDVVREAVRIESADLVVLTADRAVFLMRLREFDPQIAEALDDECLDFRMQSRTPIAAGVLGAIEAVDRAGPQQA